MDDGFGVKEALTENDRVSIRLWGMVNTKMGSILRTRRMSLLLNSVPNNFYALYSGSYSGQTSNY